MRDTFKGRFRFTEEFVLHLGREVYGQNPYEDPKRWATIQVNVIQITGKCVSIRTLRERVENLVKKYLVKAASLEGKSGIEIVVTELDDLLQQIADLISDFQKKKKIKSTIGSIAAQTKSSYLKGYDAREESCSFFRKVPKYDTAAPLDDLLLVEPPEDETQQDEPVIGAQ